MAASLTRSNGLRVASLFAGCGGLDMGFVRAGFELVWANDANRDALATHDELMDSSSVLGRLEEVTWPRPRSADVVVGGPPCQGFSVAGKMNPHDERNSGVWKFFDFVEHMRPQAFVMESVKSLGVSSRWADVRHGLVERARQLRYRTQLIVMNAADFGVPQRRERMFLVGIRSGDFEIAAGRQDWISVRKALTDLPAFGAVGNDTPCSARITPAKRPILRSSPYHGALLFNGSGRPLRLDVPAPTLPASMGGNSTPIIDQAELDTGVEPWVISYHRRLSRDRPPVAGVPRRLRRITVEEAAVLQSFPIGVPWVGTTCSRFRQIGNAVPPALAHAVAMSLAASMGAHGVGLAAA